MIKSELVRCLWRSVYAAIFVVTYTWANEFGVPEPLLSALIFGALFHFGIGKVIDLGSDNFSIWSLAGRGRLSIFLVYLLALAGLIVGAAIVADPVVNMIRGLESMPIRATVGVIAFSVGVGLLAYCRNLNAQEI